MIKKIYSFIKKHSLISPGDTVVVALSGGPDSVFLTYALKQLEQQIPCTIVAAHLNHEWRTSANKDEQFCVDFTKKLKINLFVQKISELSAKVKFNGSKEEVGRMYRQHFLQLAKKQYNANVIALGHTLDDQQETFFIRLIRGSSLSGLTGIKIKNDSYIRPLLDTKKDEILSFLEKEKIAYVQDPTNVSEEFLRNRIRHNVLPVLRQTDERFDKTFFKTFGQLQKTESFLEELTSQTLKTIITTDKNENFLSTKELLEQHSVMQHRIIIQWLCQANVTFVPSSSLIEEILRFLFSARGGKHLLYNKWQIVKKQGLAKIEKV